MSTLKILAGPAGAGHETWAQVWKREDPKTRRVIQSTTANKGGKGLGLAMELMRGSYDVCLILTTEHDVEVLNFAGPDDEPDKIHETVTALQEVEL